MGVSSTTGMTKANIDYAWRGKNQRGLVRREATNAPGATRVSVVEVSESPRRIPSFDLSTKGSNSGAAYSTRRPHSRGYRNKCTVGLCLVLQDYD